MWLDYGVLAALAVRMRGGDSAAGEELMAAIEPVIRYRSYVMYQHREDSEDATQDAMLKVYTTVLDGGCDDLRIVPFAYGVLRLRRFEFFNKRDIQHRLDSVGSGGSSSASETPEEIFRSGEKRALTRELVQDMKITREREVIQRSFLNEESALDIQRDLNINAATYAQTRNRGKVHIVASAAHAQHVWERDRLTIQ